MKFFSRSSDGGKDSGVTGFFLVEIKPLFSIVLLRFTKGTREAYHEHAFNAWTLWLKGYVKEHHKNGPPRYWEPWQWKYTDKSCCHKVEALADTWALSFRGPWQSTWREWRKDHWVTLTHGRKEV